MRPIDEHLFASGDEDGVVKLWDNRVSGWEGAAVMECKQFEEFVSDIFVDEAKKIMVASSGEGWNYLFILIALPLKSYFDLLFRHDPELQHPREEGGRAV